MVEGAAEVVAQVDHVRGDAARPQHAKAFAEKAVELAERDVLEHGLREYEIDRLVGKRGKR